MIDTRNGEELLGYKKKSFVFPYNGGEIWFEHLAGIYYYENLVLNKLTEDAISFSRSSSSSFVCFVFEETNVTDKIISTVKHSILDIGKQYMKIASVGLDRLIAYKIKKELSVKDFGISFFSKE